MAGVSVKKGSSMGNSGKLWWCCNARFFDVVIALAIVSVILPVERG